MKEHADVTAACLDAETMAAWADGGLSGEALESVEAHVADCARCQALVGALARVEAAAPPVQPHRHARRWLAWLVPLTAAATGVALWVAVPRDRPQGAAPSADKPGAETLHDERQTKAGAPGAAAKQEGGSVNQPLAPPAELRKEAAGTLSAANATPKAEAMSGGVPPVAVGEPPAPPGSLNAAERPLAAERPAAPEGPAAPEPPAAAPTTAPAAHPAAQRAFDSIRESAGARTNDAAAFAAGRAAVVVSPDPAVRWRMAGSVVERSTNGGAVWDRVPLPITAELTAAAAPSATVCWLVGRGGVVLLSTDGRSWRRLTFPEATDLSAVSATDARTASVTAADGRVFGTTDGGITWTRRPLQDF